MKRNNNIDDERMPDFLREMSVQNPFKTPHNYFKQFPDQIMERIDEENSSTVERNWWQSLISGWQALLIPKPVLALAMVLIVGAVFWLNSPNSIFLEDDFTSSEIAQYVQEHIDEFEISDFYVHDFEGIEILGESMDEDEIDPLFEDLMDDIDLETIQRIL